MINVAVIGASGYGGGELLRLLLRHPEMNLKTAVSGTYAGKPLSASFPGLAKRTDLVFSANAEASEIAGCDVVFLAQDNGKAITLAPPLLADGKKVVDLSADFRFRDTAVYEQWYKTPHTAADWNSKAVYGLPEIHAEQIKQTRIVGNPGCYCTATLLALAPLLTQRLIDPATIIVDAKSGVSGAGRSKFMLDYHFPELNESVSAYKIAGTHRHTPEIEQTVAELGGKAVNITFTPHLIPMTRGILATCYASLTQSASAPELLKIYSEFYANAPFVAVIEDGLPASKHTVGSNMCHVGLAVDTRTNRVTVVSAIDNLIKGAAGQAIQNMNLMCGFDEKAGLDFGGIWP